MTPEYRAKVDVHIMNELTVDPASRHLDPVLDRMKAVKISII